MHRSKEEREDVESGDRKKIPELRPHQMSEQEWKRAIA